MFRYGHYEKAKELYERVNLELNKEAPHWVELSAEEQTAWLRVWEPIEEMQKLLIDMKKRS